MKRKPGRPRGPGRKPKFDVSVSRGMHRAIQAKAIALGVSMRAVVEMACAGVPATCEAGCADCTAEAAGI